MPETPLSAAPEDQHAHLAAETFRMLADPTRVKILWTLFQGECSVNVLAELVGVSATVVSQHLAKLRLAGLVQSRRAGTYAYYRATDAHVQRLLAETLSHAEHQTGLGSESELHRYRAALPLATTAPSDERSPRA